MASKNNILKRQQRQHQRLRGMGEDLSRRRPPPPLPPDYANGRAGREILAEQSSRKIGCHRAPPSTSPPTPEGQDEGQTRRKAKIRGEEKGGGGGIEGGRSGGDVTPKT
ncbi:hypothetical protein MGYG_04741 [Nannizzia gypsea CBS 118893]|uniref:Uncharacterized protein n=1 Tax=Arthroderma gypseum (strain ATCC MYA-4604 / CBS 118893) TaxID=535722 RepID=E4UWI4_ARTGP|nr:hypothetical protein MGYG_04741 [Nannizzia gypsea CBS 118893]EFR01740.1 hypothetical protein MGYG_04741 [Nannizzia gypsea CBS 118893]